MHAFVGMFLLPIAARPFVAMVLAGGVAVSVATLSGADLQDRKSAPVGFDSR